MIARSRNFSGCGPSAKFTSLPSVRGSHKSCGSGDMIYFNLQCEKNDTYDYLIAKCDNSISQAFLTYFVLQSAEK